MKAHAVAWSILLFASVAAQEPAERPAPDAGAAKTAKATEALAELLAADKVERSQIDATARELLAAGQPGIAALGRALSEFAPDGEVPKDADRERLQKLNGLVGAVGLGFMSEATRSRMVFAGQYEPLMPLQPFVGQFFLRLLLDTPQSFPLTSRNVVVLALRDLYPKPPSPRLAEQIAEMAKDDLEPLNLREQLAYLLAQWGDRELVQDRIAALEKDIEGREGEDRAEAQKALADLYYNLRDYQKAADLHRAHLRSAEKSGAALTPSDYYNAACNMSLAGDLQGAVAELERALELQKSEKVDSSTHLPRAMFENDPDLRAVRATDGFKKLVEASFGKSGAAK